MWGQRGKLSPGARGGRPGSRHEEGGGKKYVWLLKLRRSIKYGKSGQSFVKENSRALKISVLKNFICLDFLFHYFFLQNIIDFSGRIVFVIVNLMS